jgi:hypothetical protein
LSNLHTVLQLCAAGALRCSEKTSRPSAAPVRALGSQLAHGDSYLLDPIASFAWPLTIQAGGLATIEGGRLKLTPKGRTVPRRPPTEFIRAVAALAHPRGDRRVQPTRRSSTPPGGLLDTIVAAVADGTLTRDQGMMFLIQLITASSLPTRPSRRGCVRTRSASLLSSKKPCDWKARSGVISEPRPGRSPSPV